MEPCVIFLVVAKQHEYLILGTGIICSYSAHKRKMCFGLNVAEGMVVGGESPFMIRWGVSPNFYSVGQ